MVVIGFVSPALYGFQFLTPMEVSEWRVDTSRFECALTHPIRGYGMGEFIHTAGEDPKLLIQGRGYRFAKYKTRVSAEPPPWRPGRPSRSILEVGPIQGKVLIADLHTNEILSELSKGMQVGFRGILADSKQQPFDVYLSSVGFQTAYTEFKRCEDGLLPANFSQIERSRIQYEAGTTELPKQGQILLDKIALYLAIDDTVLQVFIDGHTDNAGLNKDNIAMSEIRAQQVTDYLLKKGVPEAKIVTRYHGEKYPVATNRTNKGRGLNRRTTIRLSRDIPKKTVSPNKTKKPQKTKANRDNVKTVA